MNDKIKTCGGCKHWVNQRPVGNDISGFCAVPLPMWKESEVYFAWTDTDATDCEAFEKT